MKKIILSLCLILSFILCDAQNRMYAINPQSQWNQQDASIENIDITIRPLGIYAEVKIAFDLMSNDDYYSGTNVPLEYVFQFDMDKQVVFNDSWLWIENYISKGEIYEAFEGTAIYEGIVDRQQDPSILKKHDSNSYSLRVYPLDPDSTRRVQLSYLQILEFDQKEAIVKLPMHFIEASNTPIYHLNIHIIDSNDWSHYELDGSEYNLISSNSNLTSYKAINTKTSESIRFMANNASQNYYFGTYEQGNENFYQLAYFPEIEIMRTGESHLIVLDYDQYMTTYSQAVFINEIEKVISNTLYATDSFNICYKKFATRFSYSDYVPATTENISSAFERIREIGLSNVSRIESLLPDALVYLEESNQDATLTLISNNTEYYRENNASQFLNEMNAYISMMEHLKSLDIIDYANRSRPGRWINGIYYTGNSYLFQSLSNQNNGLYYEASSITKLNHSLEAILSSINQNLEEYTIDLEATNGFTYSNYFNTFNENSININQPILLSGKFIGTYPFVLQFRGIIEGETFNKNIQIDNTQNLELNSKASKVWHANYLLNNEFKSQPQVIQKVLDISLEESLLCAKSVFLCLEPDSIGISNENFDLDDNNTVAVEELLLSDDKFNVFPNPFVDEITIKIDVNSFDVTKDCILTIYSESGSLLLRSETEYTIDGTFAIIKWNLSNLNTSGFCVLNISNGDYIISRKLISLHK